MNVSNNYNIENIKPSLNNMDSNLCFLRYFPVGFEVMSGILISCCLVHVAPLGDIILIQSKHVFALMPLCCMIW